MFDPTVPSSMCLYDKRGCLILISHQCQSSKQKNETQELKHGLCVIHYARSYLIFTTQSLSWRIHHVWGKTGLHIVIHSLSIYWATAVKDHAGKCGVSEEERDIDSTLKDFTLLKETDTHTFSQLATCSLSIPSVSCSMETQGWRRYSKEVLC